MNHCLLCGRSLNVTLSLPFLLSFKAYQVPVICDRCRKKFERISKDHCCQDCHRAGDFKNRLCSDCRRWRRITKFRFRNHSLYRYNSMMSQYMRNYKFQGDYRLRKVFQKQFSQFVLQFKRTVVLIPVHQNTYHRRGFNQVRGLLDGVTTVPALTTNSTRKNVPQSQKTRDARLKLPQPFKFIDKFKSQIQGQNVLIVDDVYTTGTTIHHAARLLKLAGSKSIVGVTLAR